MALMRMNQAIGHAIRAEMLNDERVVVWGEDVAVAGGPFKSTVGLLEEFGADRVRDTPISELGFVGAGVGAAAAGLRPVVEVSFVEFMGGALDQLVTQAAKFRYLSRGQFGVPLTVRASVGAGVGFGAQHSQTLESWFLQCPGLKVVTLSGAASAFSRVRAAIRDEDPVIVLEPKALYGQREDVDLATEPQPLEAALLVLSGTDVTVIALGRMVGVARAAIEAAQDWSGELIDLGCLVRWDREMVVESVRRTGKLVTVEESPLTGGWGAEIVAHVASKLYTELTSPVLRVTAPDVPVPANAELEARYAPDAALVGAQISALLLDPRHVPAPWWEKVSI